MKKVVISSMIGNALEWYDFALYGHLATIISKLFFPSTNPMVSLITAFSVFAAGFLMRPIGGILFGFIGDKFGRKVSLIASILMMAIPTTCIGLLPTYAQIGIAAPIILTIIRLAQGLALGGGFSGTIAYIIEHAPENKRGLVGSASVFSMCAGILIGLAVSTFFSHVMSVGSFEIWGWRIPFLLSSLIGLVTLYMRDHLHESPVYLEAKKRGSLSKTPVKEVLNNHLKEVFIAIGIYLTVTVPFYTLMIFMNSYMTKVVGQPMKDALLMNTISILIMMAALPFASSLSDRIGRKPVLVANAVLFVLLTYPCFLLLNAPGFLSPLIGQTIFGLMLSFYIAPVPAILVELFPTSVRLTGISLSYNASAALFGGTTPAVATWLIRKTEMNNSLAFYIMLFAMLSLWTLYYFKDNYNKSLA